jgi:hypothetical protein
MPRVIAVIVAAVLGISTQETDHAWVFLVDDLHISFAHTGRLRDLLRTAAKELIQEGDRYLFRASGPLAASVTTAMPAMSADREFITSTTRMMTGNGLKARDIGMSYSGTPSQNEVLYRANVSLDAAEATIYALIGDPGRRQAIIYVSRGYDVETFPALEERVRAFARRARENNITIFAIDLRGLDLDDNPLTDPRVDAAMWERYLASTRRSLTLMTEESGGFVIERANEPAVDLKRINAQMR